jgi:hypothetical protein
MYKIRPEFCFSLFRVSKRFLFGIEIPFGEKMRLLVSYGPS